jgi:tRNA-2-methylthio-N6-dimethylallyladenosine synthase
MSDDIIAAHGEIDKLMPYLHLPVQSGSDKILAAMNRQHTREHYFTLIERIRATRSDLALSTDIIVGFPGETDKDFEDTLDLVRRVGFASHFAFKYSARPGTPASTSAKQVPEDVKDARLQVLQSVLLAQMREFNASCQGRTMPVLFEKRGRFAGQAIGRSPYLQSVHVENAGHLIGQIRDVRIDAVFPNSLKGVFAESFESVAAR